MDEDKKTSRMITISRRRVHRPDNEEAEAAIEGNEKATFTEIIVGVGII